MSFKLQGIELISANINAERKRLWFMNVSLGTYNSFEAFANNKHFHFVDEEKISSIFYGIRSIVLHFNIFY